MGMMMRTLAGALLKSEGDSTTSSPAGWFINWLGGGGTKSVAGPRVTPTTALAFSRVWACCNVRSQDVGRLDCFLMRRLKDDEGNETLKSADDHWAYHLILTRPNPRMTPMEFKLMLQLHTDLRGNAYAFKQRARGGQVIALWPLPSQHVTVLEGSDGALFYRVSIPNTEEVTVPAGDIIHRRGMSLDGKVGLSPIAWHKETIGLGIAAENYGASFFGNSAQPNGALKVPTTLSPEATKLLREGWESKFKGARNGNKLAIFDGGMEWMKTGMDNTDAQYLETRKFQNSEINSMYRMPPHKVGDLDKATFSNIEHQGLEYVTDCLDPELVAWCQTFGRDLLTEEERKTMFFSFDRDPLLRGDFKTTMEGFAIARQWSIYNPDECRAKLGENPIAGGKGKIYLEPLNYCPLGTPMADRKGAAPAPGGPGGDPAITGDDKPENDPKKRVESAKKLLFHAQRLLADAEFAASVQPAQE